MSDNNDDILDAAVVGGGVSGLYSAWRLMRDAGPATFPGPGRPRATATPTPGRPDRADRQDTGELRC